MLSSPFLRTAKVRIDVLMRTIGLGEVALIVENEVDVEMQKCRICSEMQCAVVCKSGFVGTNNTITLPSVGFALRIAQSVETLFDSSR